MITPVKNGNFVESVTITLSRPFAIDGNEVTEFTMRTPLVRDLIASRKAAGTTEEKNLDLIARLCGFAPADLYALPSYDYEQLCDAADLFSHKG